MGAVKHAKRTIMGPLLRVTLVDVNVGQFQVNSGHAPARDTKTSRTSLTKKNQNNVNVIATSMSIIYMSYISLPSCAV